MEWRVASLNQKRTEGVRKETQAILYAAQILPKHKWGPDRGTVDEEQWGRDARYVEWSSFEHFAFNVGWRGVGDPRVASREVWGAMSRGTWLLVGRLRFGSNEGWGTEGQRQGRKRWVVRKASCSRIMLVPRSQRVPTLQKHFHRHKRQQVSQCCMSKARWWEPTWPESECRVFIITCYMYDMDNRVRIWHILPGHSYKALDWFLLGIMQIAVLPAKELLWSWWVSIMKIWHRRYWD